MQDNARVIIGPGDTHVHVIRLFQDTYIHIINIHTQSINITTSRHSALYSMGTRSIIGLRRNSLLIFLRQAQSFLVLKCDSDSGSSISYELNTV